MADRVTLRSGFGTNPPSYMRPGELAYSPADFRLWIADRAGVPHHAVADTIGSGTGGGLSAAPVTFDSTIGWFFDGTALTFDAA
jgi:hypothetical protein